MPAQASVLDIGVGANCIYPLIGQHEYGWRFTGTDTSEEAIRNASAIIDANPGLNRAIRLRRQKTPDAIFNGVIHKNERYDATLCNPPFHDSADAASAGNARKRRNLGLAADSGLNFGGQQQELWCEGGEVGFITRMIDESTLFARQVLWFTTLVSKGDNLPQLYRALEQAGAVKVVKKEMAQARSKAVLSPGALWIRPSANAGPRTARGDHTVGLAGGRAPPAGACASAALATFGIGCITCTVCTGGRMPARSKCFFTMPSSAKRTVHCFSG